MFKLGSDLTLSSGGCMKKAVYVVKVGRKPGIYATWAECKAQVDGFNGAVYKAFPSEPVAFAGLAGDVGQVWPKVGFACDGGSKGNPGPLVCKVYDLANRKLIWTGPDKPMVGTNNAAEFIALGKAMSLARSRSIVYCDSITAMTWLDGKGNPTIPARWIEKAQGLQAMYDIEIRKWEKDQWGETPADCK